MFQKAILQSVFKKAVELAEDYSFKVTYWDDETEIFGNLECEEKEPDFHFYINEKLDLNEIRKNPQLKLGEAYMDGKIDLEGRLREVLEIGAKNLNKLDVNFSQNEGFWERQEKLSREEQEEGVRDHYDLGNDFFRLWQDETMTYSCAYFKSRDDSLKEAQLQKIDHILKKLNLSSGEKLLDIGCGWGYLAIRAAEKYGVEVLGITLSDEQLKGASDKAEEKGLTDRVEIRKQDFRALAEEDLEFDKVVSVGMFEHVGQEHIPEYFAAVGKLLKPGGLSLLHSITHLEENPSNTWLEKYIFPWGYIPSLREVIWQMPEYSFHILDVENIGRHYALTAERWGDKFEEVTDQVCDMFDEKFVRMWRLFLAGVVATFRYGDTEVHQILFSKGKNNDLPLTRDYIYENEE